MQNEIKPGDIVRLKSDNEPNSQSFTVAASDKTLRDYVIIAWFDYQTHALKQIPIHKNALVKVF